MHILVLEQHLGVRTFLSDALRLKGYQVTERSGEALEADGNYDLVLVEPGMDKNLFFGLLAAYARKGMPMIVISAWEETLLKAWRWHIPALQKPFRVQELYALVVETFANSENAG